MKQFPLGEGGRGIEVAVFQKSISLPLFAKRELRRSYVCAISKLNIPAFQRARNPIELKLRILYNLPYKTYLVIIFIILITAPISISQNLVPNPSFEIFEKCPNDYTINYKKMLVPGWYMPTGGTPDYFNSCTKVQVGVPQNFMGNCFAKDGKAYIGLILLLEPPADTIKRTKTDYREYIEAKLNEPLVKNQLYVVKFYFSIATNSTYAINRLGVYLSDKKIGNKLLTGILNYKPQVCMDTTQILTEKENWFEVADTIQAKGNEQYITIGNFYDDKKTKYVTLSLTGISRVLQARIKENQIAYYFIDLVSVIKVEK